MRERERERERERVHLGLSAAAPKCNKECFSSFVGWLYVLAYFMNDAKEKQMEKERRSVCFDHTSNISSLMMFWPLWLTLFLITILLYLFPVVQIRCIY